MKTFTNSWSDVEAKIGGELGKEVVREIKNLYTVFDRGMVTWQANLYDPAVGGFYFSQSARDNEPFLPDCESTIATLGFATETGMTSGRSVEEAFPEWFRTKIAKFAYSLQDEDGYFYHPQWGKEIGDLRKARDYGTCIRLMRYGGIEPKYPLPTMLKKGETYDISKAPERFRSVENFKAYLDSLNFDTGAYAAASLISSSFGEVRTYSEMLGVNLFDFIFEILDAKQRPDNGFWDPSITVAGTNGVHKVSKIYNWSGHKIPYVDKAIESTLKVILDDHVATAGVEIYNPWCVLGSLLENKRNIWKASEEEMQKTVAKIWAAAPAAIRKTYEKILPLKKEGEGIGYGNGHKGQYSAYGSPVAVPGSEECNINVSACGSCSLVSSMFYGLDMEELMMPMFGDEDFKIYLDIIENKEREWKESLSK